MRSSTLLLLGSLALNGCGGDEETEEAQPQKQRTAVEDTGVAEEAPTREEQLEEKADALEEEVRVLEKQLEEATTTPEYLIGAPKDTCGHIRKCILDAASREVHKSTSNASIQLEIERGRKQPAFDDPSGASVAAPIRVRSIPELEVTCANETNGAFTNFPGYVGHNEPVLAMVDGGTVIVSDQLIGSAKTTNTGYVDIMAAIRSLETCHAGGLTPDTGCVWSGGYYPGGIAGEVSEATQRALRDSRFNYDLCINDDSKKDE